MIEKPSDRWRGVIERQEADVAAGTLAPEEAGAVELWPPKFTAAVDDLLGAYEQEIRSFPTGSDEEIWAAVERVVSGLTATNGGGHIETGEREELLEYIYRVLEDAGIDTAALTARAGMKSNELTDDWRDW